MVKVGSRLELAALRLKLLGLRAVSYPSAGLHVVFVGAEKLGACEFRG